MITVVAYRDKGWFGKEFENNTDRALYEQTCSAYGANLIMLNDRDPFPNFDVPVIIFDEDGLLSLEEFEHPKDAVYVFGRSGQDLKLLFPNLTSVRIQTPNKHPLFGCVACGIVLKDRFDK